MKTEMFMKKKKKQKKEKVKKPLTGQDILELCEGMHPEIMEPFDSRENRIDGGLLLQPLMLCEEFRKKYAPGEKVIYAALTLPGGEKKGATFNPVFFSKFNRIKGITDYPYLHYDDYFVYAYWPELIRAGKRGVYIPSPYGVACGEVDEEADRIVFDRFLRTRIIDGWVKESPELCDELIDLCDELWDKWIYDEAEEEDKEENVLQQL